MLTKGRVMSDNDHKYWYNSATGEVEFGLISPSVDRIGPFDTAQEAQNAPEVVRRRSAAWAEDDAAENGWNN